MLTDSFLLNLYIVVHVVGIVPCLYLYFQQHLEALDTQPVSLRPTPLHMTLEVVQILLLWTILVPIALLWIRLYKGPPKPPTQ